MNNQKNNNQSSPRPSVLPFFVEFVKFATVFSLIVAIALFTLRVASAFSQ
ncbi:MAG: hypothetical protein WAN50_03210 [Minisyncoccia bacterium]